MIQRRVAYAIIYADNPDELTQRVTEFMSKGFMPQGGPFATGSVGLVGPAGPRFYQAMMLVQEVEVSQEEGERRGLAAVPPISA